MGKRKEFTGTVISDKMQKTVIVRVMRLSKHHKYGKIAKRYNKFKAHDEENIAKMGDIVRILETRPLSKDKHFRVAGVLQKAKTAHVEINDPEFSARSGVNAHPEEKQNKEASAH